MNQQQHQQPENLVNWLDNTFIGRILTMPNLERNICLAVWGISLAILCSTLLHGTFFPATAKDTEQKGAEFLEKEIDEFHSKMVKLLEKANTQKETIAQLRSTIEQQAKEIDQMHDEKNSKVRKLTSLEQLVEITLHLVLILCIVFVCLLIIALLVLPCWLIYDCYRRH